VKHILKIVVLSSALALCVMLFNLGNPSASGIPAAEAKTSPAVSGVACATFCNTEGGPFFLNIAATSESVCSSKGGEWFPDSGCCCKCSRPGFCL